MAQFVWGGSTNDGEPWTLVDAANNVTVIAENIFDRARRTDPRGAKLDSIADVFNFFRENEVTGDLCAVFAGYEAFDHAFAFYFPSVPKTVVVAIAYTEEAMREAQKGNTDRAWSLICAANFKIGMALNDGAHKMVERESRSIAGLRGAESRKKPYEALKRWALQMAAELSGTDKKKSAILFGRLPPHLASVSDDPQRLIYETLLAQTRARKRPS